MTNQIQFLGVDKDQLINEIVSKVKSSLLAELEKRQSAKQSTYLSAQDICEKFAISKPTVHSWRARGILKPYKLGSRIYYRLEDIEKAMITEIE